MGYCHDMSTTTPTQRMTDILAQRIATLPNRSDRYIADRLAVYGEPSTWGTYQRAVVVEAERRGLR